MNKGYMATATAAMPQAAPDPTNPIDEYTHLPGIHRTLRFNTKMTGTKGRVILEGHDISHLVAGFDVSQNVGEAITVHLTLVRLEVVFG